jgi:hypothetical protein
LGHRPPTFVSASAGVETKVKHNAAALRIVTTLRPQFQITVAPDLHVIADTMSRRDPIFAVTAGRALPESAVTIIPPEPVPPPPSQMPHWGLGAPEVRTSSETARTCARNFESPRQDPSLDPLSMVGQFHPEPRLLLGRPQPARPSVDGPRMNRRSVTAPACGAVSRATEPIRSALHCP